MANSRRPRRPGGRPKGRAEQNYIGIRSLMSNSINMDEALKSPLGLTEKEKKDLIIRQKKYYYDQLMKEMVSILENKTNSFVKKI